MKKFISIICAIIMLACVFTACNLGKTKQPSSAPNESASSENVKKDESIDFSTPLSAKQKANVVDAGILDLVAPYKTVDDVANIATQIVEGTVVESSYHFEGSDVFTTSVFKIENVIKGDLKTSDEIKVRQMGGFVPSDELSKAIQEEKYGKAEESLKSGEICDLRYNGDKTLEKGEKAILMLVEVKNDDGTVAENTFETVRLWQGKYVYSDQYSKYVPYIPADEISLVEAQAFTLDEFTSKIEK